jgi:hypothetical protein
MQNTTSDSVIVEFSKVITFPTVIMDNGAIRYARTNGAAVNYVLTDLPHVELTLPETDEVIWWTLPYITRIRVTEPADGESMSSVHVWHQNTKDPKQYLMSSESLQQLQEAWKSSRT